jgi:microcystin-dependent protein
MDQHEHNSAAAETVDRRNILSRLGKGVLIALAAVSFQKVFALGKGLTQGKKVKPLGTNEVATINPFLGEIIPWPIGFAPKGWALCAGQVLPINQNQALFALLGTTYGGDGRVNFALPDLRGRMPVHAGNGYVGGQTGGEESHTLIFNELPSHSHTVKASNGIGSSNAPLNNIPAVSSEGVRQYGASTNQTMGPTGVSSTGGSQPHDNMPPFLVLNYIIALTGIFPSRS